MNTWTANTSNKRKKVLAMRIKRINGELRK